MFWLLFGVAIIAISYRALVRHYSYWTKKRVTQGNPVWILGDNWGPVLRKQSEAEMTQMMYEIGPGARYCGGYQFLEPILVLKDPELIKQITVKDFDHFVDHRAIATAESDPLFGNILIALTGQRWRDMRSILSPAFTSSKMKHMFCLISQNGEQFVKHFLKKKEDLITIEMKDTFTRFANDVIANAAFGIECDSLEEPKNMFYETGKEALKIFRTPTGILKFVAFLMVPSLCKILRLQLFSAKVSSFFTTLVKGNIASREKNSIVRPDMINLLMEARKQNLKHEETNNVPDTGFATVQESEIGKGTQGKIEITDQLITSQALIFFFAGFETVSSLMCFMSHELAVNADIQERLRREVDETMEKCDGKLTYEALMNMKYMDMVVSESLRKWPLAPVVDRVCTKAYTIEAKLPNEEPLSLVENDTVVLPIYALHRDPKYFPDPDRFDPERFNEANKTNIQPYTYLPFGSGPRNCIGSRFALMETKTLFFNLLAHFEIVPVEKTQVPLKLAKTAFAMTAEKDFWLGLKRRVK